MYCPNCGAETSVDQKFCRGCGAGLGQPSQVTSGLSPGEAGLYAQPATPGPDPSDQRSKYVRLGFILFWGGIMLAAMLGILGDAAGTLSWRVGRFIQSLAWLGGLTLLGGIGVMIYSRLFAPVRRLESPRPRALPLPAGTVDHPGQQAHPSFDNRGPGPAPSVTEHTTYALDNQRPGSTPRGN
jgi:hypothetical protein